VNKLPQTIQNFIAKNLGWWSVTREKGFWLLTKNGMFEKKVFWLLTKNGMFEKKVFGL
jgi:hypothetical protein